MTLIQECVPALESIKPPRRRHSLGSAFLKRASSLTRLMVRQGSKRSCREETTTHGEYSDSWLDYDPELIDLRQQVKENIGKLKRYEAMIESQYNSCLALALARYTSGNDNMTGAILSMRKAHKYRVLLAFTEQARMQLYDIRVEVRDALRAGGHCLGGMDVAEQRDEMKQILLELKQNQATYSVPYDTQLLYELKQHLRKAESM